MTGQMAVGFLTANELHELCQAISLRIDDLFNKRGVAAEVGNTENVEYWTREIDAAKSAQRKLLMAYSV